MAIEESISPWEAMEIEANETTEAEHPRRTRARIAVGLTSTVVLVVLAALAILVLLPALAARAALAA